MNDRICPLCRYNVVPVYRALCHHCFNVVPWKLRGDFLVAWHWRAVEPVVYQETLVELLEWNRAMRTAREVKEL